MDTSSTPRYTYVPLPGPNYIRLLHLDSWLGDEATLSGSMIVRSLEDKEPEYTSLSYSWGRNSDGDTSLTRSILVDDCTLDITENLYDCLIQLSQPRTSNAWLLWIDAICINQANVDERGNQVSIMANIYECATNLVIWLGHGESEKDDEQAMDALSIYEDGTLDEDIYKRECAVVKDLYSSLIGSPISDSEAQRRIAACKRPTSGWACVFHRPPNPITKLIGKSEDIPWLNVVRLAVADSSAGKCLRRYMPNFDAQALLGHLDASPCIFAAIRPEFVKNLLRTIQGLFEALVKLCQRRYFTRRWVVQEINLSNAEEASVRWGSFEIKLVDFNSRLEKMQHLLSLGWQLSHHQRLVDMNAKSIQYEYAGYNAATKILRSRNAYFGGYINSHSELILSCLHQYEHTACTDDRDVVYAFLSITGQFVNLESECRIKADYRLSANEVFVNVAIQLVEQNLLGMVLCIASWQWAQADSPERLKRAAELPSWVPDLRSALPGTMTYCRQEYKFQNAYKRRVLTLQAKVGRLTTTIFEQSLCETVLPSGERDFIPPKMSKGDYICAFDNYNGEDTIFLLRPITSSAGIFSLAGSWKVEDRGNDEYGWDSERRRQEKVWDHCADVETKMIQLV